MTSSDRFGRRLKRSGIVRSAFILNDDNLGRRVVSGASFTFLGIAIRTFLTLSSVAVLARLLSPADFGYIAMATVVTEFTALFSNFGFNAVLIQRRVISRLQIDTVFWASVMLGALLSGSVFLLSFFASWLFAEPLTGELLRVLCVVFVIEGLAVIHSALLVRLMNFRIDFLIHTGALVCRAGVAILFAYMGFGVWSLVAGPIAASVMTVVFSVIAVPYCPRFRFHLAYLTAHWKISGSYFGGGLLFYLNSNLDLLLIGRQLGATSLGYYQNARSLTDEVRSRIAIPLQRVLFPAFSAIQHDQAWMQNSVMRSGRILAAIIFPVGFGLSAVAQELVPVLYGKQWFAMIPVVIMMGLSIALRGSTAIITPVFNSKNRVGLSLKYNIFGTIIVVVSIIIAVPYGLKSVATAIAIASFYSLVIFRVGLGLIGLNWKHVWQILGAPFLASAIMWGMIAMLRLLGQDWITSQAMQLFFYVVAGAVVYTIALHIFSIQYFNDFKILAQKFIRRT